MVTAKVLLDQERGGYYIDGIFYPFENSIQNTENASGIYFAIVRPIPDNVEVIFDSSEENSSEEAGN